MIAKAVVVLGLVACAPLPVMWSLAPSAKVCGKYTIAQLSGLHSVFDLVSISVLSVSI